MQDNMQDELMRLLEKIEGAPLGNRLIPRELINDVDNNIVVERRELIADAFEKGYIVHTNYSKEFDENNSCRLTIAGIELLDKIRMRKATELIAKSSTRLESLTRILIVLTIVLIILTTILVGDILLRYFIK